MIAHTTPQVSHEVAPEISIHRVYVTPEVAEAYLVHNTGNRPISWRHVDDLARAMLAGRFHATHIGVAFGVDGTLKDGQHRLLAIVKSGVPQWLLVARGITDEATRDGVDRGRVRTDSDAIQIAGTPCNSNQIAVAKQMLVGASTSSTNRRFDLGELQAFFERHHAAIEFATEFRVYRRSGGLNNSAIYAAIARAYYHVDHGVLQRFKLAFWKDYSGAPCEADQTVASLKQGLLAKGMRSERLRLEAYQKTQAAIRSFADGRGLKRIHAATTDLFPLPEHPRC
jgi:hypothetical protein